jgi:uncharacterized protein (TIGR00375 family)
LYIAAQLKGVKVVGTGDFTYPSWFSEICEKLEPAESGLFKLKNNLAKKCDEKVPQSCRSDVRFILSTEISNIYKKGNKTRKNHNLILVPDLQVAEKFSAKLDNIGNIKSDGRPILGLDARDLLEILLETSDQAFLIPAHIWTPWFSVLGSKSGFDSIEECFGDLTSHIFAVETGLSSDPPMNWRVSALDGLTLVSNSDAHSPSNIGREANLLNTLLSFPAIKAAIQTGDPETFLGTFEFYPQEGKYHLDGHRKCNIRLEPRETMKYDGKCPVCGKGLTMGVLYRVEELADREQGIKPQNRHSFYSIVQLADILAEIFQVGAKSKKVLKNYQSAIEQLGSEFSILHFLDTDVVNRSGIPLLGEAVRRMRNNEIDVLPGFDGEYGKVKIFKENERERLMGQKALFSLPEAPSVNFEKIDSSVSSYANQLDVKPFESINKSKIETQTDHEATIYSNQLNRQQREAVEFSGGPMLIVAGPGTGKTRTLTQRIAYLITEKGVPPQQILAVTFTNKAAQEMRERLTALLVDSSALPAVDTFHSFCFKILNEQTHKPTAIIDDDQRKELVSEAVKYLEASGTRTTWKQKEIIECIVSAKQQILSPDEFASLKSRDSEDRIIADIYRVYQELLSIQGFCDYEDLLFKVVRLFESKSSLYFRYQNKVQHIFVDEYQDLNHAQYRIIRALAPNKNCVKNICVIGDPDQAIYGFRGSDIKYFKRFIDDYPGTKVISLTRNYRSTQTILDASFQVIRDHRIQPSDFRVYSQKNGAKALSVLELPTEKEEAEAIAGIMEQQIGGTGFHSIDTGMVKDPYISQSLSYSDFAVLYRTNGQHRIIADVFEKSGIPFQIVSRETVLKQKGLMQIITFLKIVEGKGGFLDFESVIQNDAPGIGKKTMDQFKTWCYQNRFSLQEGLFKAGRFPIPGLRSAKQMQLNDYSDRIALLKAEMTKLTVAEKLHYIEKNTRFSGLLKNDAQVQERFTELVEFAHRFEFDSTEFFTAVALQTDTDYYMPRIEKVSLTTMHAAKGLEFPVVFITGCEEDFIPYKRDGIDSADTEEERRLFYVAMTRAMEKLYLTRAKKRKIYGKIEDRILSSYVSDIENRLRRDETPTPNQKTRSQRQVQLKLFS